MSNEKFKKSNKSPTRSSRRDYRSKKLNMFAGFRNHHRAASANLQRADALHRRISEAHWFCARRCDGARPEFAGTSHPTPMPTLSARDGNRRISKDPAYFERKAAMEALKQRCRTERGLEISSQDLCRVAACKDPRHSTGG
jgi:hypothetical protein